MRRSVFLAVWLGLALSLLKEASTVKETDPGPIPEIPTSTPPEASTVKETVPGPIPEIPTSTPPEASTVKETDPGPIPEIPTSTPPEASTVKETDPGPIPEIPTSTPPEASTVKETVPGPTSEIPTSTPPETETEPSGYTTAAPTSTPTEASTVKETDPGPTSELPTSAPPAASTVNATSLRPTSEIPPVDFCREYPCGRNLATCISLNSSYTCECPYGFYYSNKNCFRGKVYPATITVKSPYSENLDTVNSMEYEQLFNNLSNFFASALKNLTGYRETLIVEIRSPRESSRSVLLNVTVANLFTFNSTENDTSVNSAVQNAIKSQNQSYVESYDVAKQCDIYRCDTNTTKCEEDPLTLFPECKCKPDLERTEWDDRSCSACSKSCSAVAHKYCVREEGGPVCKCMTNFKEEDGKCVACPVGYSGEKCNDYSELILIIVGTVFGAIILSLVIAVSIISVRAKHKRNPEKRSLIKSGYSDRNSSDDRPSLFPRVQTTSGHANPGYQPNNPYEMRSTNRDGFPERDYDDMYETSREPRGFRTQNRY